MQRLALFVSILFVVSPLQIALAEPGALYKDPQAPLEQRVDDLFGRLTQDEKLSLLGGTGFTTQPIPRLGVPGMAMADAGQGVRGGPDGTLGPATAFPAGVLMASTWDTNLLWQIGQAIGDEGRNKGTGVQVELGPAVNIQRSPLGGRNAEYFSEDPYLAAQMAVHFIEGLQSTGNSACVKHFACNNEEVDRGYVNVIVGERALREIYLPAFEAAVKEGKVGCVMDAYNKVNGFHCSANPFLLTEVLKHEWGFDGLVMSDWGAVHETAAVQAGNDLEMPTGENMNVPKLKAALADGTVTQAAVDDSVHRILRTIIRVGLLDGPMHPDASQVNSPAHQRLALEVAENGIILLKNKGNILPLDRGRIHSIAVIGEAARHLQVGALGSPAVQPFQTVEILDGIQQLAGDGVMVRYAAAGIEAAPLPVSAVTVPDDGTVHGFRAEYYKNPDLAGPPALVRVDQSVDLEAPNAPAPGFPTTDFSVRWTARLVAPASGNYVLTFTGDDGYRVFLDGKVLIDNWVREPATTKDTEVSLEAGKSYELRIEYFQAGGDFVARLGWRPAGGTPYADALAAAKASDVAVVCVSTEGTDGEGNDRPSMDLPHDQAALIRAIADVNKKTIVVMNNGTPVIMTNWLNQTPGVIEAWYPGEEGGAAIAAILFGEVDPSGHLPTTVGANRDEYPDAGNFPGRDGQVNYAEGIYVGYRHFDKAGIQPLFPFGYGLSYTTFRFKHLKLSNADLAADGSVSARADITNTGKRAGEEVVQLYIHDLDPKIDKPIRELKGFSKVALLPGETKTVQFTIQPRDLAYFDVPGHQWKADAGEYEIEVGASSRDIRLTSRLSLSQDYFESAGVK